MRRSPAIRVVFFLLAGLCAVSTCRADDLNDGIEADDSVQAYSDINTPSRNFSYLTQRARSKAASGSGDVLQSKNGALNSVIMEAGAKINGDIIIIDQSKGNKTILSE